MLAVNSVQKRSNNDADVYFCVSVVENLKGLALKKRLLVKSKIMTVLTEMWLGQSFIFHEICCILSGVSYTIKPFH